MSRQTSRGACSVTFMRQVFKLSRAAFYAAQRAQLSAPKPCAPPRRPRPGDVPVAELLAAGVVAERRAWGVRNVRATLRRRGLRVGQRRVWALMNAHGLVLAGGQPRPAERRRGQVVVPEPNRRIASDFTTTWTTESGTVAIAITVDCGCRTVLDVTVSKSQASPAMLGSIDNALVWAFGAPENAPEGVELRTDHGSVYTGGDAAAFARRWGITHTFAPVGRPTGNAVAERTIRTMKEECIWLADWSTIEELQEALYEWQRVFNQERPHQALKYATPSEYRAAKLGTATRCAA